MKYITVRGRVGCPGKLYGALHGGGVFFDRCVCLKKKAPGFANWFCSTFTGPAKFEMVHQNTTKTAVR